MPHKDGQDAEEKPSERRQRLKSERDPNSPRKTRSSRPKVIDPETGELVRAPHRKKKDKDKEKAMGSEPTNDSTTDLVPELARTSSAPGMASRSSLPYPTFSKAHSKEAVNIREDNSTTTAPSPAPALPKTHIYTPDSTDLGGEKSRTKSRESLKPTRSQSQSQKDMRPPSPPDTIFSEQKKATPPRTSSRASQIKEEIAEERPRSASSTSQRSWFGRPKVEIIEGSKLSTKSKQSKTSTAFKSKGKPTSVEIVDDEGSELSAADDASAIDSNATSIAPQRTQSAAPRAKPPGLDADDSPESNHESSPRTPTATPQFPHHEFKSPPPPSPFVSFDMPSRAQSTAFGSPMPPPPPPPPEVPLNFPRVDYLLQNGGLLRQVPRNLISVAPTDGPQTYPSMNTPAPPQIERVFGPFYALLDQYETVINRNGSIAVATGYRSVARRLLDRLENVFNRELPSGGCTCVLCRDLDRTDIKAPGWGDILEAVSGRREIPTWPAMDFVDGASKEDLGLGISGSGVGPPRPGSPVKIDPDIAEEFHQHYLRQTKKTKASVDKWLNSTPGSVSAPPPDVDDETLTFTVLTHLQPHERPIFNALIAGSTDPVQSMSRAPTPNGKPRADLVVRASLALQRLYHLPEPPRDPEICVYLLKNPDAHPLLLSLSEINNSEWEILVSGRFDGFLWSGAEAEFPGSMLNSPVASRLATPAQGLQTRGTTPFSPGGIPMRGPSAAGGRHPSFSRMNTPFSSLSRGPTPSQFAPTSMPPTPFGQSRQAVSNDEETEIAMLAELEREIYVGMEALEDAFEGLHRKAETVRRALRERGAGLSVMAQTRLGIGGQGVYARLATPAFGERGWEAVGSEVDVDAESDWGGDDTISELAPDDSASNISSSRHRRPKRRTERRTPAPVEEEDED